MYFRTFSMPYIKKAVYPMQHIQNMTPIAPLASWNPRVIPPIIIPMWVLISVLRIIHLNISNYFCQNNSILYILHYVYVDMTVLLIFISISKRDHSFDEESRTQSNTTKRFDMSNLASIGVRVIRDGGHYKNGCSKLKMSDIMCIHKDHLQF